MTDLAEFLLARIAEDEAAAKMCGEMFPPPWEVADRGWRVRIYASDVPIPNLMSDDEDAMTTRNPVVIEVEPDRHIDDPRYLSERVEHVRRHDPARVLTECDTKRRIVELHSGYALICAWTQDSLLTHNDEPSCETLRLLALPYSDHPDYREEWRP